jgi:hypothetical protein
MEIVENGILGPVMLTRASAGERLYSLPAARGKHGAAGPANWRVIGGSGGEPLLNRPRLRGDSVDRMQHHEKTRG